MTRRDGTGREGWDVWGRAAAGEFSGAEEVELELEEEDDGGSPAKALPFP